MSVVHTHYWGRSYVPSHHKGAALAGLSHESTGPMGFHRSCNPRRVRQHGLVHDHRDESIPYPHPSSLFQSSLTRIISRRRCRKPWPNRKSPRQCEAASRLPQLCRRRPTLLSSLTAASCWGEAPFWGMHKCRWTATQTPGCHRKSTHLSYSQFALWRCCMTTFQPLD